MKPAKHITLIGALAVAGTAMLAGAGHAAVQRPVPDAIKVPDGNERVAAMSAKGVQTYTCTDDKWTLLEPAATLHGGGQDALHSRGPVWVSTKDGSAVNASAVATSPRPGTIPEVLLKATATRGDGVFGKVSYVQRLRTRGGLAPAGACTGTSQVGVPYTATYTFYAPSK